MSNLMETMEIRRAYSISDIRARVIPEEENSNQVSGHAAIYSEETIIAGLFREVIEPGAFDNTDFSDVLFTANHDLQKIPLARSRRNNGNSTLYLELDQKGLFVRATLDVENNTQAKALYSSVKRGDIDGMSFIFKVKTQEWTDMDTDLPLRRIKEVEWVKEVAAVNFPAYKGTDIDNRAMDTLENAKKALENARSKELDNSSDIEVLKLKNKILAMGGKK